MKTQANKLNNDLNEDKTPQFNSIQLKNMAFILLSNIKHYFLLISKIILAKYVSKKNFENLSFPHFSF